MQQTRRYCGFRLQQRNDPDAVVLFVFAAKPKDVAQWVTVNRLEERQGGIQRRLSQARVRALARFFTQEPRNVIPTSIVLAFAPNLTNFETRNEQCPNVGADSQEQCCEWGTLSFSYDSDLPETERPAFVVDGQHRLFGMASVGSEDLPILICAMLEADLTEQAFQFVVINNKVTRVPPNLVRSLIVDFDEDALQKRLESARVSLQPHAILVAIVDDESESPFYQMVNWERRRGSGRPSVNPQAIEDSLKHIRRRFNVFDDDQDALIEFFFGMWRGVKDAYPELWENTENHLFENAGFKAFSEYLTDEIETLAGIDYVNIDDTNTVAMATKTIAGQIDERLWRAKWVLKSLDTSAGRDILRDAFKVIRQNRKERREWFAGLSLVETLVEPGEDES